MVEADFSGSFTNSDNCSEGDKGVILSEGEYEEKTRLKGGHYNQLNIDVEVRGKKLTHSPGINDGKALVAAWGKETKGWIGKIFVCHVVRYFSNGQTKQKIEIEAIKEKDI